MGHTSAQQRKRQRNIYISYVKGFAMFAIVLIHLINWTNINLSFPIRFLEEFLYTGLFLFVLTTGSVVYIAYKHRPSLWNSTKRLLYRGIQLLFFYYLYNIVKFFVFDFSTEPFYLQFIEKGTFTLSNILGLKSFSVPITILPTYSFLLFLSPFLLLLDRKVRSSKIVLVIMIVFLFFLNYGTALPFSSSGILAFLYANDYSVISIAFWLLPFLFGFLLAQIGFEYHAKPLLIIGGFFTLLYAVSFLGQGKSIFPSDYQFPLGPYFIAFSIFVFALLLYFFRFFEKKHNKFVSWALTIIQFVGDRTLYIYLYHWIIIDLTIWIFFPNVWVMWITVPMFFLGYFLFHRAKFVTYHLYQKSNTKDMRMENL